MAANFRNCICMWFFWRFQAICLQSYPLDFFQQGLDRQFDMCVRLHDKHIPKYFPRIRTLMAWIWQKGNLLWLFSIVKLNSSKSAGCISTLKSSQNSIRFSESESEKNLGIRTLLWKCQEQQKSMVALIIVENI